MNKFLNFASRDTRFLPVKFLFPVFVDLDPHRFALILSVGSGSALGMRIRFQVAKKYEPQKRKKVKKCIVRNAGGFSCSFA
jgi:hypothetical protein